MNGKKIGGWIVRDGIAAVDETSLPWGPHCIPQRRLNHEIH